MPISLILLFICSVSIANLEITVKPNKGWGKVSTSNIKELCKNVSLHFQEQLRDEHKIDGKLTIVYRAQGPVAFYRNFFGGNPNEYKIGLKVTDTHWSQFSYQFAHEFCHILMRHDTTHLNNPNIWFYESLCELANLWVIRRMGETWSWRAPYKGWQGWRHNLTNYANHLLNRQEIQYNGTGKQWLNKWESKMREDINTHFDYAKVSQLSYKFLRIFEKNPEAWNAVRQIPASKQKMDKFMSEWYNKVDIADKQFVKDIAKVMGINVVNKNLQILSEVDDHITYLTLIEGDTPIPNKIGLNPKNVDDTWTYWGEIRENFTNNLNRISIGGIEYDRGISVVPDYDLDSVLIYDLTGAKYNVFKGYIGLADEADINIGTNANASCNVGGSVIFIFEIDDKEIFKSDIIDGTMDPILVEFNIPIKSKQLKININSAEDTNWCDGAAIGNASLIKSNSLKQLKEDVNSDGQVDLTDVKIVRLGIKSNVSYNTDLNNDGKTDEIDVLLVKNKTIQEIAAAAPSLIRRKKITTWGALKSK